MRCVPNSVLLAFLGFCLLFPQTGLVAPPPRPSLEMGRAAEYYVATNGSDATGTGTQQQPWATITTALGRVPDGSTIVVQPGTYVGQVRLDEQFAQGVVVRAAVPYQSRLRNNGLVVRAWYGEGITLEGFDIAHSGSGSGALVIQIQDLLEQDATVSRITLRNNILHDSYNNDILKINNGARDITVSGNVFYNQTGSDEHIDINSVTDVFVHDNIFFNDFARSGRVNGNTTSAYVVIKDSNGTDDANLGSKRISLRRNVFLNWQGSNAYGFIQIGEDGTLNYEADTVLVENNLMIGNASNAMRSPIGIMGSRNITVNHNTIVGNLPSNAFAMRVYAIDDNQPNQNIHFFNNIWSDPTGTINDFSDSPVGQTASFQLDHNLYWNNGAAFPFGPDDLINMTADAHGLTANPLLGTHNGLVVPHWDANTGRFADGSLTIRGAFEALVNRYGAVPPNSPAVGAADSSRSPSDDILGTLRRENSTLGAYEARMALSVAPSSRVIESGQTASFILTVAGLDAAPITISSEAFDGLAIQFDPPTISGSGQSTLTVESLHAPNTDPSRWYSIPVYATSDTEVVTATVQVLVGGTQIYVPTLRR